MCASIKGKIKKVFRDHVWRLEMTRTCL